MACQRSVSDINRTYNSQDTIVTTRDTLTYEVLTTDPGGWFGVWSLTGGNLASNALDSVNYGSPVYLPSGWTWTITSPGYFFQPLLSVASRSFSDDITINLYKNGNLIKSVKNDAMKGVAKLIDEVQSDTLIGTATDPVLTYEVLVSDPDATKFESDAWIGHWMTSKAVYNDAVNPLLSSLFAMPSGWKSSFKPERLPFVMSMQASPYTANGGKITINFFVNGQLVKSSAARDWIYDMQYTVQ
jgi:hypothetical protein